MDSVLTYGKTIGYGGTKTVHLDANDPNIAIFLPNATDGYGLVVRWSRIINDELYVSNWLRSHNLLTLEMEACKVLLPRNNVTINYFDDDTKDSFILDTLKTPTFDAYREKGLHIIDIKNDFGARTEYHCNERKRRYKLLLEDELKICRFTIFDNKWNKQYWISLMKSCISDIQKLFELNYHPGFDTINYAFVRKDSLWFSSPSSSNDWEFRLFFFDLSSKHSPFNKERNPLDPAQKNPTLKYYIRNAVNTMLLEEFCPYYHDLPKSVSDFKNEIVLEIYSTLGLE